MPFRFWFVSTITTCDKKIDIPISDTSNRAIYHFIQAGIAGPLYTSLWHLLPCLQIADSPRNIRSPDISILHLSDLLIFLLPHPWLFKFWNCNTTKSEKFNTGRWPYAARPSIGVILWPPYASIGLSPQRWVLPWWWGNAHCGVWWSPPRVKVVTPQMITAVCHPSSQVWTPRRKIQYS